MKKILFFLSLILISNIFGQNKPSIIPPSPTAYELGKYGQISVGLFTGTPNISIPLMNYKTKNLTVPIFLTYNSNGIKVDQLSSNVGLGWSLNAGGVITRIVRDLPDEEYHSIDLSDEIHTSGTSSPEALNYFYNAGNNEYFDSESDLFMYNFQGKSGQFFLDANKGVVQIKQNDLLIELYYINEVETKKGFKITDANGIIYLFLENEISLSRISGQGHSIQTMPTITSWYLSKIIHPNGDIIEFIYQPENYSYITNVSESITIPTPMMQNGCSGSSGTSAGYTIKPETTNRLTIVGKRLSKIISLSDEFGKIDFEYNLSHPDNTLSSYKILTKIIKKDKNLNQIKKVNFTYLTTVNHRIFLEGLNFNIPENNYSFEYFEPNNLPERLSKSQDHWGYFNGKSNIYRFANTQDSLLLGRIDAEFTYFNIGADKSIDTTKAKTGLLTKIKYPTKGYQVLEYESNSYYGEVKNLPQKVNIGLSSNSGTYDYGTEETALTGVIPFTHMADFYVSASFSNLGECSNTDDLLKSKVRVTIEDLGGNDVNILQRSQMRYFLVGVNSVIVSYDIPDNHFFVELKQGHEYIIKIKPSFFCVDASINFVYYKEKFTTSFTNINVGGLRIKKIKNFDYDSNQIDIKRYYYGQKETCDISSGDKGRLPIYMTYETRRLQCDISCSYFDRYFQTLHSNTINQLYNTSGKSTTYYNYVTVSNGGDKFENGGIEYEYIINPDIEGNPLYGNFIQSTPLVNTGWNNGLEKKIVYFKNQNGNLVTLKKIYNSYKKDNRTLDTVYNYRINKKFDLICTKDITHVCTAEDINKIWKYKHCITDHQHFYAGDKCIASGAQNITEIRHHSCYNRNVGDTLVFPNRLENLDITEYATYSYWSYLDQTIEINYDNNGQNPVTVTTDFYYDNPIHKQLTRLETITSAGDDKKTYYYYPDDITNMNSLNFPLSINEKSAIDSLKAPNENLPYAQHRISEVIQIEHYKKGQLLTTEHTAFKDWGKNVLNIKNLILPESISFSKDANPLEPRIIYHNYDQYGNPIEVSKPDGPSTYYIWGYNKTKLIAQIQNFTQAQANQFQSLIQAVVDASDNDNDNMLTVPGGHERNLWQALNNLRNALPTDTQMTSYTYDPLIGVTSITGPDGITVYYKYDAFNRLIQIIDKDNNILKEYDYHYKTN